MLIFSDLEQALTQFSRSHHSLTLNISQAAKDTAIVLLIPGVKAHGIIPKTKS